MKQFLRSVLSGISYRSIQIEDVKDPDRYRGIRMLMYHRVTDAHPKSRLCVPVKRFAEQMRWLHEHGYRTATMSLLLSHAQIGTFSGRPTIVISFDDGYSDNYFNASPVLAQYAFTGVFFVPTGFIDAGEQGTEPVHSPLARKSCGTRVPQGTVDPADRPMTWDQIKALSIEGHEIGAHSVTHRKLTLLSRDDAQWELRESKRILEERLHKTVRFFCYPNGQCNDEVKQLTREAGYEAACTVEPGSNIRGMDPFSMKRTEVSAFDSIYDFEKKLAGAYDWMHVAAQRLYRWMPASRRQPSNALKR